MAGKISKTQIERATYWLPTLAGFGGAASLGLLFFTDWKLILQYVPFYNKKFKDGEADK